MSKTTFIIFGIGIAVVILSFFAYLVFNGKTPPAPEASPAGETYMYLCNTATGVCADTRVLRTTTAITKIYQPSGVVLEIQSSECGDASSCFAQDENGVFWIAEP